MKKFLRVSLGILLMPLYLSAYLYDRIICVPLIWIKHDNIIVWLRDETKIAHSIIRLGVVGFIQFVVWLIIR
jgi:hypothetical protein